MSRNGWMLALVLLVAAPPVARADDSEPAKNAEAAALAFVRENHPELAGLLAQLKTMRPDEYDKAIRELSQTSKSLAQLKARDRRRYEVALDSWKARSRVQLVAARLAGTSTSGTVAELESQLRQAVVDQVDVEIRRQRLEKQILEENLKKTSDNIDRLESRRNQNIESRVQSLLNQSQRARRKGQGAGAKSVGKVKNPSKAKDKAVRQDKSKGKEEPQP